MKSIVQISENNPFNFQIDDSPFNDVAYTSTGLMETTIRDLIQCGENINDYNAVGDTEFVNKFNTIKHDLAYADN
jgi:hypothetical protein